MKDTNQKADPFVPQGFKLTTPVYESIKEMIGTRKAESGGILGGNRMTGEVTRFFFDEDPRERTGVAYSPNTKTLNHIVKTQWNPKGVDFLGFVHSHPSCLTHPSGGDEFYAKLILEVMELPYLLCPIVTTVPDSGSFTLYPYVAVLGDDGVHFLKQELEVQDESPLWLRWLKGGEFLIEWDAIFQRVQHAYDLRRLNASRVICVGTGGSAGLIEDMARAGVGEFILIDHDVVQAPNVATQQTYTADVGLPKVEVIAARLEKINPYARICIYQRKIESFEDDELDSIVFSPSYIGKGPWGPEVRLLCGFTDNFYAQARVNRLALQFGIPSLCAQLYKEGVAGEITFTYPGVTPACHRCILSPRYRAYLEKGYQNTVTSEGAPVFVTPRLNSLTGQIAMALLHHGTPHPRWGEMLTRIGTRTLVQLRLHPDGPLQVFDRVMAGADRERLFFDEAVWLPQDADPNCPECGGTGDLRKAEGTFADTRIMPMPPSDMA